MAGTPLPYLGASPAPERTAERRPWCVSTIAERREMPGASLLAFRHFSAFGVFLGARCHPTKTPLAEAAGKRPPSRFARSSSLHSFLSRKRVSSPLCRIFPSRRPHMENPTLLCRIFILFRMDILNKNPLIHGILALPRRKRGRAATTRFPMPAAMAAFPPSAASAPGYFFAIKAPENHPRAHFSRMPMRMARSSRSAAAS